ncbi:hypothetical protein GCM10010286_12750 [Streptomyces toxytricini]|nr:hypothetical protein GCM10010286_12750 [Streptomyces toxytricini]
MSRAARRTRAANSAGERVPRSRRNAWLGECGNAAMDVASLAGDAPPVLSAGCRPGAHATYRRRRPCDVVFGYKPDISPAIRHELPSFAASCRRIC